MEPNAIIDIRDASKEYATNAGTVRALSRTDVSIDDGRRCDKQKRSKHKTVCEYLAGESIVLDCG